MDCPDCGTLTQVDPDGRFCPVCPWEEPYDDFGCDDYDYLDEDDYDE